MSYCSRSRRRRFTLLDFKSWAYSRIYGHFQQNLYCRSIPRPRFSIRVQNFGDLATFSLDFCILYAECRPYSYFRFVWSTFSVEFCILYAECPPYFYFRLVSPIDLESIPHASTPTSIIPTKFEVDMTIRCRVIAFLSAETLRDFVTLIFAFYIMNVRHISTSGLFDLLT